MTRKGTYESSYKEVENELVENVKRHEPYLGINYEELERCNFLNLDYDSDNEEFSMLNPGLIDFEEKSHESGGHPFSRYAKFSEKLTFLTP